jgi:hypothetical protein
MTIAALVLWKKDISTPNINYEVKEAMLCLRAEDAFVITCVANLMEVKALYVQQDMRYEISSYWRFNV